MVTITAFHKDYGHEKILSIESLQLDAGVYFIRGENGSGKTTLFKCLAGIVPCEGKIIVDDVSHADRPIEYRRRVNFAEAEPKYPDFLTARDLLHFVGKSKRASHDQIEFYMERLGITNYASKPCGTYSSGMMKKLSLALAFLGDPRMILLDEPLTTLDSHARNELLALIREKDDLVVMVSSHHEIEEDQLSIASRFIIKNKHLVADKYSSGSHTNVGR